MVRVLYAATAKFGRGKDKQARKKRIASIGRGASLGGIAFGGLTAIANRKNLTNPDTLDKIAKSVGIGAGIGALAGETNYRIRRKIENRQISLPGNIKVNRPRPFEKKPKGILNIRD